jgi:hypothetical protein
LLEGRRQDQILLARAYVLTGIFEVLVLAATAGGSVRAVGTFRNPNYPGHFLLCAMLLLVYVPWRRSIRLAILAVFAYGLLRTGSFSTLPFFAAVAGYWIWVRLGQFAGDARMLARGFSTAGVVAVVLLSSSHIPIFDLGSGLTTSRFEKSSSGRYRLWSEGADIWRHHPLGIGPDGITNRGIARKVGKAEIHSDTLDTLVAGGPLALFGLLGMVVVIWRVAPPRSASRALLFGLIVDSVFRQTWNFRHMWLALAIAIALDRHRWAQERGTRMMHRMERV